LSTPVSTKILVALGIGFVVVGFGIAGWQRLTKDEAPEAEVTSPVGKVAQPYLPDVRMIVVYLGFVLIAIMAGAYVLIRSRRRRAGY
jgi:hypothetical protein